MKKHDEGYALVLVIVVILVLGIVSAGLTTMALANVKGQRASVDRMADKYAAAGKIEAAAARLNQETVHDKTGIQDEHLTVLDQWLSGCLETGEEALKTAEIKDLEVEDTTPAPAAAEIQQTYTYSCTVNLIASSGETEIACQLSLSGEIRMETQGEAPSTREVYIITPNAVVYDSYDITRTQGGGDTP